MAGVEDEVPDFEQDRALTRQLDADEVAGDVNDVGRRRVDEPREVVVAGERLAVGSEREDAVDVGDQRSVRLRDRRQLEDVASVDGKAAIPTVDLWGLAGHNHRRVSSSSGCEREQQNGCAEHGKNEAAHEVLLSDVGSVRRGWIEAPATGRLFGDHPEVAAAPGKTLRPSALRSNPKDAAVVVVDPHRAKAD